MRDTIKFIAASLGLASKWSHTIPSILNIASSALLWQGARTSWEKDELELESGLMMLGGAIGMLGSYALGHKLFKGPEYERFKFEKKSEMVGREGVKFATGILISAYQSDLLDNDPWAWAILSFALLNNIGVAALNNAEMSKRDVMSIGGDDGEMEFFEPRPPSIVPWRERRYAEMTPTQRSTANASWCFDRLLEFVLVFAATSDTVEDTIGNAGKIALLAVSGALLIRKRALHLPGIYYTKHDVFGDFAEQQVSQDEFVETKKTKRVVIGLRRFWEFWPAMTVAILLKDTLNHSLWGDDLSKDIALTIKAICFILLFHSHEKGMSLVEVQERQEQWGAGGGRPGVPPSASLLPRGQSSIQNAARIVGIGNYGSNLGIDREDSAAVVRSDTMPSGDGDEEVYRQERLSQHKIIVISAGDTRAKTIPTVVPKTKTTAAVVAPGKPFIWHSPTSLSKSPSSIALVEKEGQATDERYTQRRPSDCKQTSVTDVGGIPTVASFVY